MKILLIFLFLVALGYAAICALLYFNQDRLLFFPSIATTSELDAHARQIGLEPWTNPRGERIGWKSPDPVPSADGRKPDALIFCHGNGGLALSEHHANLGRAGFQMFLLEYPGYGDRTGEVSTQSFVDATIDAIDTLAADSSPAGDRLPRRIFLLGESLGSGVVSAATAARPDRISGLVLLVPFDSLAAAAGSHYPWLPVRWLLRHRLDSDRNLEKFHGPIAFIVAGQDTTIPPRHGEHLYQAYQGPKRLWLMRDAGHNDFDALFADWPQIADWLRVPSPPIENRKPKIENAR